MLRAAHSIKGGAAMMGFQTLTHLAHRLEDRQGATVEEQWLEAEVNPLFEQLHDRLGDPQQEDNAAALAEETGENTIYLLFETEVEAIL
ncbi:MAG: hypothetical protein BRC41_16965 [Cyanobacteria bacterium QH_9_48_43]|nr:MAG: hypothetical protein BRC41_16965 [Cyanobacteria bacterium QH_9_48_43]